LSDEQAAAFGRFVGEPSQNDLERFFYLDDADQELIRRRRGEHSRLGVGVQVGTARFLGTFLADPLDVPWSVVDYVAAQLGIADPSVAKRYTERVETANTHAREIRAFTRHRINLEKITTHWDDMTRVAASLVTGSVRAYDLLRMLTRDNGSPSPLGAAVIEYGRIAKTLH